MTLEQPLDATGLTTTLEVNTTDYSEDMRAMMRAYVMQRNTVPGTTYLFIVPGFKDNPSMAGYMPLKSGYGFLTPTATTRDAAHELGHGVFNLRHTFSTNNMVNLPEGTTQNLMDYSAGTELFKYQWDFIHSPEGGWFIFEDESEGAFSLPCVGWFDDCKDVLQILETFRNSRINGNNVKIKGQENTEERVLVANYVKIGDTNYKKLRLIYKPKYEDYLINPLEFDEYDKQFFIADGSVDTQRGVVYYQENDELFKIIVDNEIEKIDILKDYLYGSGISFEVMNKNSPIKEEEYITISAEPEMPEINVKNTSVSNVKFRLKIEYRRDIREDEDYFPENDWKTVKPDESWTINFGDKFRGGKATLLYKTGSKEFSFIFYIRGLNPTEQDVMDYIEEKGYNDIWFFTRLIRQESTYRQFNNGTNYGPSWTDSQGCPNWGPPHGWGLTQLDLLEGGQRPTAQELWNWKANVDRGYQFLNGEKWNMVNGNMNTNMTRVNTWNLANPDDPVGGHADQVEGSSTINITYTHSNSGNFSHDLGGSPADDKRSFIDAAWIKNYNGSSGGTNSYPGYYYICKQFGQTKPYWDLHRTNSNNENYVELVSRRAE